MSKSFLAIFGAMVLAGIVLILSLPYLFGPHELHQEQITIVAGWFFVVFAVVMIVFRAVWRRGMRASSTQ